jgi:hypothetical protein
MNTWLGLKRPLFLSFFLGCTVSFLTSGTLTLRLIGPATLYWSFVPLVEIAALASVCWSNRQNVQFSRLIDSFFRGYGPWLLWLVGMCAIWACLSPSVKSFDGTVSIVWLGAGGALAIAWSFYIDFSFFRSVLGRSPERAARDLALQRLISWSLIMSIIAAPTIWSDITGRLW